MLLVRRRFNISKWFNASSKKHLCGKFANRAITASPIAKVPLKHATTTTIQVGGCDVYQSRTLLARDQGGLAKVFFCVFSVNLEPRVE
jgi:hypothetical protein